jgi:MoaA/NifB/PqqE/SkfB family radical SAM enzyme
MSDSTPARRIPGFVDLFDRELDVVFADAVRQALRRPALARFLGRTLRNQRRASRHRRRWGERGVHVPPLVICSVTDRCNLRCPGCYAQAHQRPERPALGIERLGELLEEAAELGVGVVFLAGGEPFMRPEIIELAGEHRRLTFPVFTNGTLIDDEWIDRLARTPNVFPAISLEGRCEKTDARRGAGTYEKCLDLVRRLDSAGAFSAVSITLTKDNFAECTGDEFARELTAAGCRLFIFVEYVPVRPGTEDQTLDAALRERMIARLGELQREHGALFIAFPGDEEPYEGCLSAGRGFVHIGPDGGLEPCPFAPYSDVNLVETDLKDALNSEFLRRIQAEHDRMTESEGGCALWTHRDWVRSLLRDSTERENA